MMPRSHTHGCPDCGTVTTHFCFGGVDEQGHCEYDDEPNEIINRLCPECYAAREQEQLWEHISPTQAVVMMMREKVS